MDRMASSAIFRNDSQAEQMFCHRSSGDGVEEAWLVDLVRREAAASTPIRGLFPRMEPTIDKGTSTDFAAVISDDGPNDLRLGITKSSQVTRLKKLLHPQHRVNGFIGSIHPIH